MAIGCTLTKALQEDYYGHVPTSTIYMPTLLKNLILSKIFLLITYVVGGKVMFSLLCVIMFKEEGSWPHPTPS